MIKLDETKILKTILKSDETKKFNAIKTKGKSDLMDINNSIEEIVKRMRKRAEYEMSDTNYYRNIAESIKNESGELYCKSFGLSIEQTPKVSNRHFLLLNLLHPKMKIQSSRTLAAGNKKEIIKYLEGNEVKNSLKNNLFEMSKNMEER